MKKTLILVIGAMFLLCGVGSAQIINGNFNQGVGNLDGWTVVPGSSVSTIAGVRANLSTPDPGPAASLANISTALSVNSAIIDNAVTAAFGAGRLGLFDDTIFSGSAIFQTITATAGDVIQFDMSHNKDSAGGDFAFASLVFDPSGTQTLVAPTAGPNGFQNNGLLEPGVFGFTNPLSGVAGSWNVTTSGVYKIGFAILNTGNPPGDQDTANFGIVNVRGANAIPEIDTSSATLPLAAIGLMLLMVGDGRRRRLSALV